MAPTILSGNSVVVGATRASDLKRNDIVLFAVGARLFAHRFVGWRKTEDGRAALEFCGDANAKSDPLVAADDVIGVVLKVETQERLGVRRRWATAGQRVVPALASGFVRAGYQALSEAFALVRACAI
jgi:hypothetical protein